MSIDNKYMDVYGCPIKETQDALLASVNYAEAIDGLNGYFTSEPRNDYITIRRQIDSHTFFLYDPEKWADILISWLRTKHGIFYYPGMEAKYAKTERIPPLTERLMDEGALNSLKKLHKRVVGEEPEVDSHTLIADGISHAVSVKEAQIEELKTHIDLFRYDLWDSDKKDINKLISDYCNKNDIIAPSPYFSDRACVEYLFSVVDLEREHRAAVGKQMVDDYKKDIMDRIRQEASLYGLNLPEKVDGEPFTIERAFHDLFDLMMIRGEELRTLESKCNRLNEIVEELNTLNNEIKEDLP